MCINCNLKKKEKFVCQFECQSDFSLFPNSNSWLAGKTLGLSRSKDKPRTTRPIPIPIETRGITVHNIERKMFSKAKQPSIIWTLNSSPAHPYPYSLTMPARRLRSSPPSPLCRVWWAGSPPRSGTSGACWSWTRSPTYKTMMREK